MDEKRSTPLDEDPRDRFHRLIDESKESEEENASEKENIRNIIENLERKVSEQERQHSDKPKNPPANDSSSMDDNRLHKKGELGNSEKNKDRRMKDDGEIIPREVSKKSKEEIDESQFKETLPPLNLGEDTPPPELGTTPYKTPPAVDSRGMPLPRRVDQIDLGASRATPIAYKKRIERSNYESENLPKDEDFRSEKKKEKVDLSKMFGCFIRMVILGVFALAVSGLCLGSFVIYEYFDIAKDLPDVAQLRQSSSQFETTRILDRNGNVLYEILDPHEGRRTYVTLNEISPYLIAATIATEDKDFYINPGFDPLGIIRAFWQNLSSRETVSGASTITQQLTRLLLFSPEERNQRTYIRKVREAILASEVTRRYSKNEILELYLNEIYYGNLAYGIEAASQTYFGIPAKNLDLGQAAFLAGLPQLPSFYDVYSNRDATLARQHSVLLLMFQVSQEKGCIYVSNNLQPICIGAGEAALAAQAMEEYQFVKPKVMMKYPHWVTFIRNRLEEMYDPQTIYRSGFEVYTTIDPGLQNEAQKIIKKQVDDLKDRHVTNGSLVAIQPHTGEILAMVGSADFNDEKIDGQINMAIVPRQPGSSIKPITYVGAFEKGWTPATLIWDVPSEFPPSGDPNDTRSPYKPVNYDRRFHGPVTVRSALANSYNIPAVKALSFLGIYDNPMTSENDGFISLAHRLGITTLTRNDYGLSLTLGGGEVSLYEMTKVYAIFANGGRGVPVHGITKIVDYTGKTVYESKPESSEQLIRPEHAYLITSILADNEARTPAFGPNSILHLPFEAAVKTGTTNDFRDNWTIGYTPDIVVGVWVGNADYTPMINTSGLTGAAPIWANFMQLAIQDLTGGHPSPFIKPAGVIDSIVCEVSGTVPSRWCPSQKREYFAADQPPLPKENDLWKKVLINTWTGLLASPECNLYTEEKLALNISDPWAIKWVKNDSQGQKWVEEMGFEEPLFIVPNRRCNENDTQPKLEILSPQDGAVIKEGLVTIIARIDPLGNFKKYRLEYGLGADPAKWEKLKTSKNAVEKPTEIYEWDVHDLDSGEVTLRLYLEGPENKYAETRVRLTLQVPTPTPTPTPTFTPTPTQTLTPTPTSTPLPTNTPTPYYTPTWTPIPIFTIQPSPTP